MKAWTRTANERDVVRLARAGKKRGGLDTVARTNHHLLGQLEVEHLGKEAAGVGDPVNALRRLDLGHQQAVVQMHRARALDVVRPWIRIDRADTSAHCFLLREQDHPMATRQREADRAAHEWDRAGLELLDLDAAFRDRVSKRVDFGVSLYLVRDI